MSFLAEFLRNPSQIGAVAPSSRHLARAITQGLQADVIAELGPGTGVFTRALIHRYPAARIIAIDANRKMADTMRRSFPHIDVHHASASALPQILNQHSLSKADAVISGLPFAAFPPHVQEELLDAIVNSLRQGGEFRTFAYIHALSLPAGRRFRKKLHARFSSVHMSRVIWKNLPPAIIYTCAH